MSLLLLSFLRLNTDVSTSLSLSGNVFSKSVFVTFRLCRRLRVRTDQRELARIGSPYFRPDIQVRGFAAEQVYHLEILRHRRRDNDPFQPDGGLMTTEYLGHTGDDQILVSLLSVALVRVERGAR